MLVPWGPLLQVDAAVHLALLEATGGAGEEGAMPAIDFEHFLNLLRSGDEGLDNFDDRCTIGESIDLCCPLYGMGTRGWTALVTSVQRLGNSINIYLLGSEWSGDEWLDNFDDRCTIVENFPVVFAVLCHLNRVGTRGDNFGDRCKSTLRAR
jgi:hypothetical protein